LKARRSPFLFRVVALCLTGIVPGLASGNPQAPDTNSKQIEVRLIPERKAIEVGEALEVRIEIRNAGLKTLFIESSIYEPCGPTSPLSLRLELGPPVKPQVRSGCAADCAYTAKDSFAARLVDRWTVLPTGDFYGTTVTMHPDSFPQLSIPGRWRLRGTYKSTGNLSSSLCFDSAPIPDNEQQIKGLPYEAWQGEVDTNTTWVEVVRAGSSGATKKSR
jgi:hypothetical protein